MPLLTGSLELNKPPEIPRFVLQLAERKPFIALGDFFKHTRIEFYLYCISVIQ